MKLIASVLAIAFAAACAGGVVLVFVQEDEPRPSSVVLPSPVATAAPRPDPVAPVPPPAPSPAPAPEQEMTDPLRDMLARRLTKLHTERLRERYATFDDETPHPSKELVAPEGTSGPLGLRYGDRILAVNGRPVPEGGSAEFSKQLLGERQITLLVERTDGRREEISYQVP